MALFLEILAETCSVAQACKAVNMSRQSAYGLRARLNGQPFDLAWEAALELGLQRLAQVGLERALYGVSVPIVYRGEVVGERTCYSDRLLMFMMANPNKVGRLHVGRDYAAQNWREMLLRVAEGPMIWQEDVELGKKERRAIDAAQADFFDAGTRYPELVPPAKVVERPITKKRFK